MNTTMQDAHNTEYGVASVKPKSRVKLVVLLVVGLVLVLPILYVAAIVFVAQPVKVEGAAMSPTLTTAIESLFGSVFHRSNAVTSWCSFFRRTTRRVLSSALSVYPVRRLIWM